MNTRHFAILKQGVKVWNRWREDHPKIRPDLSKCDLGEMDLSEINFDQVGLEHVRLRETILVAASLHEAMFEFSSVVRSDLRYAYLTRASVGGTYFRDTNLSGVVLAGSTCSYAQFQDCILNETDFSGARILRTVFSGLDLSLAKGLEFVVHHGPCTVGIDTIYGSAGKIPESFLRGCGVPEALMEQIPSLIGAMQPIQYHSCFISYSNKDDDFARKLHGRMRQEDLRVWFAPEEMKGGREMYDQIHNAIQVHDKLLLVLSPASMESNWVKTEIRRAFETEKAEKRRKLFPIRLVDFEQIRNWKFFDADSGTDLAVEIRKYFIPDFSHWKDHDAFEAGFARLINDLRATNGVKG